MASEIQLAYGTSGRTLYAVIRSAVGQVWNGSAFESYAGGNWATYDIPLTEQGTSGYYAGDFPALSAGLYLLEVRDQSGGSPALTDPLAGSGEIEWSGTALVPLSSRLPTSSYTTPLDAAGTRSAVGLAAANLDTQIGTLATASSIAALNNLSAAQVNAEVDTALSDVGLTSTVTARIDATVSSRLAAGSYTAPLDAAGTRSAVGLAAANLDTQISTLATASSISALNNLSASQVNAEVDTALADVGLTTTVTGRIDAAVSSRLPTASYTTPLDAAGTRTAVGLAAANLDTQLGAIASDADAVEGRLTSTRAGYLDNLSAGAVPTLAQILAAGDIDGYTLEQTLKLCLAALAGKLSGAASTTVTIRAANDSKNRIVATVDANGNRTAVTLDATG